MENGIKKKVNRIGLAGQIVSIVLIVLMSVACFGCLLGGVALAVLPNDAATIGFKVDMDVAVGKSLIGRWMDQISDDPQTLDAQMSINGTDYTDLDMQKTADGLLIHASADRMEFRVQRLAYAAFSGLAYCAVLLVVFIFLKRLCDGFRRCDTPFSEDVIHRMTVFAWVMVGGAVLLSAAESIGNSLINRSLDLSFSINPTGFNSGIECSFSFAPILIALLVLFLTMIFRYGAQLQKESDETL
jgi:hypothetical protein